MGRTLALHAESSVSTSLTVSLRVVSSCIVEKQKDYQVHFTCSGTRGILPRIDRASSIAAPLISREALHGDPRIQQITVYF